MVSHYRHALQGQGNHLVFKPREFWIAPLAIISPTARHEKRADAYLMNELNP